MEPAVGWASSIACGGIAAFVLAPAAPVFAQAVVQPIPGAESRVLNAALGRLGRDPRDVAALIDAGNAALVMGDTDAATGFFRRADQVAPGNSQVKAGLAGAMVRNGDPFGALPLFEEAEKAGALGGALIGDHGLAYDLVGDSATAQRYYRRALTSATGAANDEITRRLALSLAISGDKRGAETTLAGLLARQDQAAWRTRSFALAVLGQTEEAVSISNWMLPREIAEGIAPYLRYMPKLTKAQQAAAANFGAFPRASEIGRDDPRIAAYSGQTKVAAVDGALVPRGEPLGRSARARNRRASNAETTRVVRVAPPDPMPAKQAASVPVAVAAVPRRGRAQPVVAPTPRPVVQPAPTPAPQPVVQPIPTPVASPLPVLAVAPAARPMAGPPAPTSEPVRAPTAAPSPVIPRPSIALEAATPAPGLAPAPVEPPPRTRNLADAFSEFATISTDATPAAGAVDIRTIRAAPKAKPAKVVAPPKPPPPSHPSRIWVQIATGRDRAALAFDWRRMTRQSAAIFRGRQPYVTAWGQTSRLLTGPFATEAAANAYIGQLRGADVGRPFVWTSPAGQAVDTLKP